MEVRKFYSAFLFHFMIAARCVKKLHLKGVIDGLLH